jgi:LysM repeat protein
VAGVPGYYLDIDATLNVLAADPGAALADSYLPLVLVPVAPRVPDASAAIAEAQTLLSAPLTMTAYDPVSDEHFSWTADPATIAGWLGVESTDAGPHVIVQADRLSGWLSDIEAGLGQGRTVNAEESAPEIEAALRSHAPVTLTIRHAPTTYTVQPGETLTQVSWNVGIPYWRILDANPGMDADTISVGQTLNIPSKDDLLPLPVIANKRIRVSISQQRLWTYDSGQLSHEYLISTGIDRSPTQPGIFQILEHTPSAYASLWDLTMPNFLSIYESWPGFFNGFHGLPTLSNGQLLWREILGKPASYGCIILDLPDGQALYDWADNGVVVEIDE